MKVWEKYCFGCAESDSHELITPLKWLKSEAWTEGLIV